MHPDWDSSSKSYDADIAVVIMAEKIPYSSFIAPISLSKSELSENGGFFSGWGNCVGEGNDIKQFDVSIVSNDICFLKNSLLPAISSTRTFCGDTKSGSVSQCLRGNGQF